MCKRVSILLVLLFAIQILWGYSPGVSQTPDPKKGSSGKVVGTKAEIFHAVRKILIADGYDLKIIDEAAGTLSTDVTPMRVNVSGCDCEMLRWTTEDKRPIIKVTVDVKVDDNWIAVQVRILGDYPKEQISERMIENDLFNQISHYLE